MKKILVLFETSCAISVPFRNAGYEVTTVDILPHKVDNEHHIQTDISTLELNWNEYVAMFAFPPCTYFSKAGIHWFAKQPDRYEKQKYDLEMVKMLWKVPIPIKCFENPAGSALNYLWQPKSCRIDYCQFADFKKLTDLWLQGLPPLLPEQINLKRYGNFITNMKGNRSYMRSYTPMEVGVAMLKQWQCFIDKV